MLRFLRAPGLVLLGVLMAACGTDSANARLEADRRAAETGLRGVALPEPKPLPDVHLTKADGTPFALRDSSAGKLTLLFFGFTHCPDVCPVHMTNLAATMRTFSWSMRERIQVLFVTTDPPRDTPARLTEWLGSIDSSFVALIPDTATLRQAEEALNLPGSMRLPGAHAGDYAVGHAGQVLAATPDGLVRYAYPFGTRQADWSHDLPKLLALADSIAARGTER